MKRMRERSLRFALFMVLFSLIPCPGTGGRVWAGENAQSPEQAERLSSLLHGKLEKLGSFEAEFLAEGREKSMVITMVLNRTLNYAMIKAAAGPNADAMPVMVYEGGRSPRLLMFPRGPGAPTEITPEDMTAAGGSGNPIELFLKALKTMGVKLGDQNVLPEAEAIMPVVVLALGRETLTLALGLTADRPAFSWAEQAQLAGAERIEEKKQEVIVHYSQDHRVVIDKKTGLLREDAWRARGSEKRRSIILTKYAPTDGTAPIGAHLPQLATMTVEKASPGMLNGFYYSLFLARAAEALEGGEGVERALRDKRGEFLAATRSLAADYWSGLIDQAFMEEVLRSLFEQVAGKPGEPEMTFGSFLDAIAAKGDFPEQFAALLPRETTQTLTLDELERHLDGVPGKQRKLLKEIYETGLRAYEEGFADAVKSALRKYLQEKSGKKGKPLS